MKRMLLGAVCAFALVGSVGAEEIKTKKSTCIEFNDWRYLNVINPGGAWWRPNIYEVGKEVYRWPEKICDPCFKEKLKKGTTIKFTMPDGKVQYEYTF